MRPALLAGIILVAGCLQGTTHIDDVIAAPEWVPGAIQVEGRVARLEPVELDGEAWWLVHLETADPLLPVPGHGEGAWSSRCAFVLAPATEGLQVGQAWRTTLRFEATTFNGQPAVLAPELGCPLGQVHAIATVMSAVSWVQGCSLRLAGWEDGWADFELESPKGRQHAPGAVDVSLARWHAPPHGLASAPDWMAYLARLFVNMTHAQKDWPDGPYDVEPLGFLADPDPRVRFEDRNGNGQVDDFDHLRLHMPAEPSGYQMYSLVLGPHSLDGDEEDCVGFSWIVLTGPDGPMRWRSLDVPLAVRVRPDDLSRTAAVTWVSESGVHWAAEDGQGIRPLCQGRGLGSISAEAEVTDAQGQAKTLDGTRVVAAGDRVGPCPPGTELVLTDLRHGTRVWGHSFAAA